MPKPSSSLQSLTCILIERSSAQQINQQRSTFALSGRACTGTKTSPSAHRFNRQTESHDRLTQTFVTTISDDEGFSVTQGEHVKISGHPGGLGGSADLCIENRGEIDEGATSHRLRT